MTEFEKFALDHTKHSHCISCGYCIYDQRPVALGLYPVWCLPCYQAINTRLSVYGIPKPWDTGVVFA